MIASVEAGMSENTVHEGGSASGLVPYQDGAVVSKTVLKAAAGSATVFAFDQGQELSEHTAPHDALVLLLDGEAEFGVAGVKRHLSTGDVLKLPANVPHSVRATRRFKMLLVMIRR
jgi:quercetin dioxygenase-like cupin family protein